MRSKTLISTIVLAGVLATSLSTSAFADDGRYRGHGGHGGNGGNGFAIAAGVLGALAIGSVIANANAAPVYSAPPAYYPPAQSYYQPAQSYYEAPPQYYQPTPPPQVYYQPAPVYYQPQPATVIVEGGRPWRGHHRNYYYGY